MKNNKKKIISDRRELKALMDVLGAEAFNTKFEVSKDLTSLFLAEDCMVNMLFEDSRVMTKEERVGLISGLD